MQQLRWQPRHVADCQGVVCGRAENAGTQLSWFGCLTSQAGWNGHIVLAHLQLAVLLSPQMVHLGQVLQLLQLGQVLVKLLR